MREKQPTTHKSPTRAVAKQKTSRSREPVDSTPQEYALQPIVVPPRTDWDLQHEHEYIGSLIRTLGLKYANNFLAYMAKVPNGWEKQNVQLFLLQNLTFEIPNLMGQSLEKIKEVFDTRAYYCLGFMEGMVHEAERAKRTGRKNTRKSAGQNRQ
jgi:hypothetical protein